MKTIYLDQDEEITSVVDRLRNFQGEEVVLAVPKRAIILQSLVNLKLLKRQAELLSKKIAIATSDTLGKRLAQEAGIEVHQKTEGKEEKETRIPQDQDVKVEYLKQPPQKEEPPPAELEAPAQKDEIRSAFQRAMERETDVQKEASKTAASQAKSVEKEPKGQKPKIPKKFALIGLGVAALIGLIFFWLNYPKMILSIKPLAIESAKTFDVVLKDGEVAGLENALGGEQILVEKEETEKFPSTGKKNVGEKATGSVTLENRYSTTPYAVGAGTKLTSGDKVFLTTAAATIPGLTLPPLTPGTTTVGVIAQEAGEQYNIGASNFTVGGAPAPGAFGTITARSTTAFSGGSTKQVTILQQSDISAAKEKLTATTTEKAKKEFKNKTEGKKIFDEAIVSEVTEATPNKKVGTETEEFELNLKMRVWSVAFGEQGFLALSQKNLTDSSDQKELLREGYSQEVKLKKADFNAKQINLEVSAKGFLITKLDREKMKNDLKGKTSNQAKEYLKNIPDLEASDVKMYPSWIAGIFGKSRSVEIKINVGN